MPLKDLEARRAYDRERARRKREQDPEAYRAYWRAHYAANREKEGTRKVRKREQDPEAYRAYWREYYRRKTIEDPDRRNRLTKYYNQRRTLNPEPTRNINRRYEIKHREKRRARNKPYDESRREERVVYHCHRRELHGDKLRAADRAWAKANPAKTRAKVIKRKFRQEQRTPLWVDIDEINRFYLACPEGMTVDHVIPLAGKTIEGYRIDGLHVPWNLGYLTLSENSSKQHKMRPEDGITAPLPA